MSKIKSVEKADALIKTCQTQGVKLAVIFQRRYSDGVIALKRLLEQGKLGRLIFSLFLKDLAKSGGFKKR
ncbi:hypothetical protein [Sporomusa silvacetica]|nr:hypothetical protein [Sporomusa silvacetica]